MEEGSVLAFFFFNDTATTEIYTLSLHDALPICTHLHRPRPGRLAGRQARTSLRSRADGAGEPDRRRPRGQPAADRGPGRPAPVPPGPSRARLSHLADAGRVLSIVAPPRTRPRILVVDDEMGPRESLRMILKPHYEIKTADSARGALDQLPEFRPDLVVLDIKMPEIDGLEVLRRIKRIDPTIEIVMITAYASLETVKLALSHGAFEYLIKPFSRQDLEQEVRRAVERRQADQGTRGHGARPGAERR